MILPTSDALSRSASGTESSFSSSTIVFLYRATIASTVCDIASGGAFFASLAASLGAGVGTFGVWAGCWQAVTSSPATRAMAHLLKHYLRKTEKRDRSNTFKSTVREGGKPKSFASSLYCRPARCIHAECGLKPSSLGVPSSTSHRGMGRFGSLITVLRRLQPASTDARSQPDVLPMPPRAFLV